MNKKNKPSGDKPFIFVNKETEEQLNTIARAIDLHSVKLKQKIDKVRLAVDILFELEQAGFKILKIKEKNFLHLSEDE